MKTLLLIILLCALGWFAYHYYQEQNPQTQVVEDKSTTHAPSTQNFKIQKCVTPDGRVIFVDHVQDGKCKLVSTETKTLKIVHNSPAEQGSSSTDKNSQNINSESFKCDGRTRCSQMNSCAEATYFLQNCPNVEMDGDHDGIPCEQEFCGH